jgi:hypothetical protein
MACQFSESARDEISVSDMKTAQRLQRRCAMVLPFRDRPTEKPKA